MERHLSGWLRLSFYLDFKPWSQMTHGPYAGSVVFLCLLFTWLPWPQGSRRISASTARFFRHLAITLRWHWGHCRHLASILRLLLCNPVIFPILQLPLHPCTILVMTFRSSLDHLTVYPGKTKRFSNITCWSLGYLKVIARLRRAWQQYLWGGGRKKSHAIRPKKKMVFHHFILENGGKGHPASFCLFFFADIFSDISDFFFSF